MRATTLLFGLFLVTAGGIIQAEAEPPVSELNGYAVFHGLSKEDAAKKAEEMATADFERQVYRIFVAGKPPATSAYDKYLMERYGVVTTAIAGCIVSDGILGAQEGYNSTMKPLLNRKFGRDIFKEAEQASRK